MNYVLNMTAVHRKVGIRADEISDYISVGRYKVLGDRLFDPYWRLKGSKLREAIATDAMVIANWFNSNRKNWNDAQMEAAYDNIVRIQRGPAWYYKELFGTELKRVDFEAAYSWAERENYEPGSVDMNLNPDLRERLLKVVFFKARLNRSKAKSMDLKRILALAFFGKQTIGDFDL